MERNKIFSKLLDKGDKLYSQRENFEKAKEALTIFEQYNKEITGDPEGLWRVSMAYYYVGHLLPGKKNRFQRKDYFSKGVEAGKKCQKFSKAPRVECYFWQGTNLALLLQEKGILSMAFSLDEIIDLLEKARQTDPHYASAGAYRTLAILYHKAPGFLGGDEKKALHYSLKSMELAQNEPLNVAVYAKMMDDLDQESKALDKISSFLSDAKPDKFPFFESKNAYKELLYFQKHREWPE